MSDPKHVPAWLEDAGIDAEVVLSSVTALGVSSASGVRHAHGEPARLSGAEPPVTRELRELREEELLALSATRSSGGGIRLRAEEPDAYRTCFQLDRDRIRHATAFRRLAGKTQVHIAPVNEHLRNRLTHAIEVAQVAGAIASALGLNVDLTEAMALGHDCGHGPIGHASEEAFAPYVDGGFDHAPWGADVTLAPLNLCAETLDGIRNHSWRRPRPLTPEGEVLSWADRIAYCCHDFDDAVRAGIVGRDELPDGVAGVIGSTQGAQLGTFITAMIETAATHGEIGMGEDVAAALDSLREFNYERIYLRPESRDQARSAIRLIRAMLEAYIASPDRLPETDAEPGSDEAAAVAVRWVAGMTDRYLFATATQLLGWDRSQMPAGV